jgi:transposase
MLHAQELVPSENKASIKAIKALLKNVDTQIKKLEAEQKKLIKETNPETYELATSVVGIGTKAATALSAYYGDLSQFEDHKQIVASVGINPKPQESGTSLNISSGISKRGNKRLRTLFYMAALSASKHNKACAKLYKRLIKKGKHKKTALIAVANKLIKQVFAVVKSKVIFDNNYCKNKKNSLAF